MNEAEWQKLMADRINKDSDVSHTNTFSICVGKKLPYGYEIRGYAGVSIAKNVDPIKFETDLMIIEASANGLWKPRVIIECKIKSITTHDSITYSQKASLHKSVHPYLRYGAILGNRSHHPLPGRLYRHGVFFDFMMSFRSFEPSQSEMKRFIRVIHEEIDASQKLEKILYDNRRKDIHCCIINLYLSQKCSLGETE